MGDKPLGCTVQDFKNPRLRKCAYDLTSIKFLGPINPRGLIHLGMLPIGVVPTEPRRQPELDGGVDGYNWKIQIDGEDETCVLKVVCSINTIPTLLRDLKANVWILVLGLRATTWPRLPLSRARMPECRHFTNDFSCG